MLSGSAPRKVQQFQITSTVEIGSLWIMQMNEEIKNAVPGSALGLIALAVGKS